MLTLGIETSCDETSVSVTCGEKVLSNIVSSSVHLHKKYGGVVPEIASRFHVEYIIEVLRKALADSGKSLKNIKLIAVTNGPGLVGALLSGISLAKSISYSRDLPLVGVNHILAHLYSSFLNEEDRPEFPFIGLVVSGGHTALFYCENIGTQKLLGTTQDDAVGEAYDKVAKILGLGYPGGPAIDRAARQAAARHDLKFPQGRVRVGHHLVTGDLRPELCASFSGLKTALMYHLRSHPVTGPEDVNAIAASYQEAIVGALADRCDRALRDGNYRCLAVGGGVSLNARLRVRLQEVADRRQVRLLLAEPKYCGDNAAMIAGLAGAGCGVRGAAALALDVTPSLPLG